MSFHEEKQVHFPNVVRRESMARPVFAEIPVYSHELSRVSDYRTVTYAAQGGDRRLPQIDHIPPRESRMIVTVTRAVAGYLWEVVKGLTWTAAGMITMGVGFEIGAVLGALVGIPALAAAGFIVGGAVFFNYKKILRLFGVRIR